MVSTQGSEVTCVPETQFDDFDEDSILGHITGEYESQDRPSLQQSSGLVLDSRKDTSSLEQGLLARPITRGSPSDGFRFGMFQPPQVNYSRSMPSGGESDYQLDRPSQDPKDLLPTGYSMSFDIVGQYLQLTQSKAKHLTRKILSR